MYMYIYISLRIDAKASILG